MKKLITSLLLLVTVTAAFAQTASSVLPNKDTLFFTPAAYIPAQYTPASFTQASYSIHPYKAPVAPPVVTPPVVPPPTTASANPGGISSSSISRSNETGKKISGFTFDAKNGQLVQLNLSNCTNDTITLNSFKNNTGLAINLSNCKGTIVRYNYFNMVNFGLHAENCTGTKVEYNQGLNLNGANPKYNSNFAHWIQFHACNSGGQSISFNKLESVLGVAVRPHDAISIDACSGIPGDSIRIIGNYIRGGQQTPWPTSGDTGGGIMAPDESGNYYVVRNNVIINPGCAGIQCVGTGTGISIDGNIIYNNVVNQVAAQGLTILGTHSGMVVKNNRVWWLNKSNQAIQRSDGQTGFWFGGGLTLPGVTLSNNNWLDTSIDPAKVLPLTIITYK